MALWFVVLIIASMLSVCVCVCVLGGLVDTQEEELQKWLSSPLLQHGVDESGGSTEELYASLEEVFLFQISCLSLLIVFFLILFVRICELSQCLCFHSMYKSVCFS